MCFKRFVMAALVIAGCGGDGENDGVDANGGEADAGAVDAPPDATPEPMPAFRVAPWLSGSLAIDDVGLRETFRVGTQTYYSYVSLSLLTEGGPQAGCAVLLRPRFVAFDYGSPSNRQFKTLLLDPAGSMILEDRCGWSDSHILQGLGAIGTIEVGFAQARFAEDRPYLDVFLDGDAWLPSDTASIVRVGSGTGSAMAEDGTVNESVRVEPAPGTLTRGLYDF